MLVDLATLSELGVSFSPFLEIGAGSVHRSAALINNYPVEGVATDISQHSLRDTPYVLSLLGYDRKPMLVCCDAHHLPFLENTFQFVFCYQTLHHFDNLVPVVAECYRVLGQGGHFFCNEEPMGSPLKRFLKGKRQLSHPLTRVQRLAQRFGLERIFWDDSALELSLGITEARPEIGLWREAFRPFARVTVEISRKLKLRSDLYRPFLPAFLSGVWGGNVWCLCYKAGGSPAVDDFGERLMCVDCGSSQLKSTAEDGLRCSGCDRVYLADEGVVRMLPQELEAQLVLS
jgi:SAM-dependent methyltransferase